MADGFLDPEYGAPCPRCLTLTEMLPADVVIDVLEVPLTAIQTALLTMLGAASIPVCMRCGFWSFVPLPRFAQ